MHLKHYKDANVGKEIPDVGRMLVTQSKHCHPQNAKGSGYIRMGQWCIRGGNAMSVPNVAQEVVCLSSALTAEQGWKEKQNDKR